MIVYLIRNLINGKCYVGQTRRTLKKRLWEHQKGYYSSALKCAIDKYGIENFSTEILSTPETVEQMNEDEKHYIDTLGTLTPNGYNLKTGGDGHVYSDESRAKMSASHKGKAPWNKGKQVWSEEQRREIGLKQVGRSHGPHSPETKKTMRKASRPRWTAIVGVSDTMCFFFAGISLAKDYGFTPSNIRACLNGRSKTHLGMKWYYYEAYCGYGRDGVCDVLPGGTPEDTGRSSQELCKGAGAN